MKINKDFEGLSIIYSIYLLKNNKGYKKIVETIIETEQAKIISKTDTKLDLIIMGKTIIINQFGFIL